MKNSNDTNINKDDKGNNSKVKYVSIEEIAMNHLKHTEAKIAMRMDHSILNRLK